MTRRVVIGALGAVGLLLLLPAVAGAHAVLERTTPGPGRDGARPARPRRRSTSTSRSRRASARSRSSTIAATRSRRARRSGRAETARRLRPACARDSPTAPTRPPTTSSRPTRTRSRAASSSRSASPRPGVASRSRRCSTARTPGPVTSVAFWARSGGRIRGDRAGGRRARVPVRGLAPRAGRDRRRRGGVAARRRCVRPACRRLLGAGVAAGLITSLLALPLQVATAAGTSFWEALDPDLLQRGPADPIRDRHGAARGRPGRAGPRARGGRAAPAGGSAAAGDARRHGLGRPRPSTASPPCLRRARRCLPRDLPGARRACSTQDTDGVADPDRRPSTSPR